MAVLAGGRSGAQAAGAATLRRAAVAVLVLWLALCTAFAVAIQTPAMGDGFYANDFNMFHAAGRYALDHGLAAAYGIGVLDPADIVGPEGGTHAMIYSYPPQFGFVILPLGGLERPVAFGVFIGVSLALFLLTVLSLARRHAAAVLFASLPIVMAAILSGQTALLVAALAGFYAMAARRDRAWAGLPLGLLAVKPHLAPGLALEALARGRWGAIAVAALTVALTLALSTLVFGTGVWRPFLEAGGAAAERLAAREFKLDRMTSVYALAATAGLGHSVALLLHLLAAAGFAVAAVAVARSSLAPRVRLGVALLATLGFSPYVYDYDLTILAVALAVLWRELAVRSAAWERVLVGVLAWTTSFYVFNRLFLDAGPISASTAVDDPPAIPALAFLGLVAVVALILSRTPRKLSRPR